MTTPEQRKAMAAAIVDFEARRDAQRHLVVYKLPAGDGGGEYEVAGINERYHKATADTLVALIRQGRFEEAENLADDYVAQYTDSVTSWTNVPAVEFYLRDCAFNRGPTGAARIAQRALGLADDGAFGSQSRAALRAAEQDPERLLKQLRAAREQYERDVAHRDETSKFWKGLVNRWNKALAIAHHFPITPSVQGPAIVVSAPAASQPIAQMATLPDDATPVVAPALRIGVRGDRVSAWQSFLHGRKFNPGPIDGIFGRRTRQATIAFQHKYRLAEDGVAGRQTLLKAAALGLELFEEPADDKTGSDFPPHPNFRPLVTTAQREALFGHFDFVPAPTSANHEAIRILGTWQQDNIIAVPIPQLRKALGVKAPAAMQFHRLAATQLQGMWKDWDSSKLLNRILTYDGSFSPRFVRGSTTSLSNHAFGTAFDVNEPYNKLGARPALVGTKGSVRELVPIANKWGFFWGGHYDNRLDGMHFEVAVLR